MSEGDDTEDLLGKTVHESQVDEVGDGVVSEEESGGRGRETSRALCLFGVGGLCLVEVTGAAVSIIVWHVDGGTIKIKVAAAWTAGREAADWTSTPGQDKVTEQVKPGLL